MINWQTEFRLWQSKVVVDVAAWQKEVERYVGRRVVLTNGCFDLIHFGHIELLQAAKRKGNMLVVAVNSDQSVRQLKGPERPLTPEAERLAVIAALESVDFCFIFHEKRCDQIIRAVRPDIWVKGGDYSVDKLDAGERAAAKEVGTTIEIIPYVTGHSTTNIIARSKTAAAR